MSHLCLVSSVFLLTLVLLQSFYHQGYHILAAANASGKPKSYRCHTRTVVTSTIYFQQILCLFLNMALLFSFDGISHEADMTYKHPARRPRLASAKSTSRKLQGAQAHGRMTIPVRHPFACLVWALRKSKPRTFMLQQRSL